MLGPVRLVDPGEYTPPGLSRQLRSIRRRIVWAMRGRVFIRQTREGISSALKKVMLAAAVYIGSAQTGDNENTPLRQKRAAHVSESVRIGSPCWRAVLVHVSTPLEYRVKSNVDGPGICYYDNGGVALALVGMPRLRMKVAIGGVMDGSIYPPIGAVIQLLGGYKDLKRLTYARFLMHACDKTYLQSCPRFCVNVGAMAYMKKGITAKLRTGDKNVRFMPDIIQESNGMR